MGERAGGVCVWGGGGTKQQTFFPSLPPFSDAITLLFVLLLHFAKCETLAEQYRNKDVTESNSKHLTACQKTNKSIQINICTINLKLD